MKEDELRSESLMTLNSPNWYRVWRSPYVQGKVEGDDYVDVLAYDATAARVIAVAFLEGACADEMVPSLMGTAELFWSMDRISGDKSCSDTSSDWGMDDTVGILRGGD